MARPSNQDLLESPMHPLAKQLHALAKQDAGYWSGLILYQRANYRQAVDYFTTRTLLAVPNGPWTFGARYNLARAYEASERPNGPSCNTSRTTSCRTTPATCCERSGLDNPLPRGSIAVAGVIRYNRFAPGVFAAPRMLAPGFEIVHNEKGGRGGLDRSLRWKGEPRRPSAA